MFWTFWTLSDPFQGAPASGITVKGLSIKPVQDAPQARSVSEDEDIHNKIITAIRAAYDEFPAAIPAFQSVLRKLAGVQLPSA